MIDIISNSYPFSVNFIQIFVITQCIALGVDIREMKWKSDISLRAKYPEFADQI